MLPHNLSIYIENSFLYTFQCVIGTDHESCHVYWKIYFSLIVHMPFDASTFYVSALCHRFPIPKLDQSTNDELSILCEFSENFKSTENFEFG